MKRIVSFMLLVVVLASLVGCGKKRTVSEIQDKLIKNGVPEKSIGLWEKDGKYQEVDEIYIHDNKLGYAHILVFDSAKEAKKYWKNLEDKYSNLNYIDSQTAVGDLRDVCDASIEEWIYYKDNIVASVEQCVWSEWATYIGDDGIEYYEDGSPVETNIPTPDERRAKAAKLEKIILKVLE